MKPNIITFTFKGDPSEAIGVFFVPLPEEGEMAASEAAAYKFLDRLDDCFDKTDGRGPHEAHCTAALLRTLKMAMRRVRVADERISPGTSLLKYRGVEFTVARFFPEEPVDLGKKTLTLSDVARARDENEYAYSNRIIQTIMQEAAMTPRNWADMQMAMRGGLVPDAEVRAQLGQS